MNRRLNNVIAFLLVLCFLCFAPFFLSEAPVFTSAEARVKPATHQTYTSTLNEDASCSATAVARHALLTASHCEAPTDDLTIDGVPGYKVGARLRDGNDHTIYLIANADFDKFVPVTVREFQPGENVFIWGNPSIGEGIVYVRQLHKGQYKGTHSFKGRFIDVLGFQGFHGDSGSGVFNQSGELLGVVTFIGQVPMSPAGDVIVATGAVRLAFSKEQLKQAAEFK